MVSLGSCGRGAMTTIVVKETLRKCPSDPARLSTTTSSTSKSSLTPATKSAAAASKSSSSTSALHLAPFSKCVLTLDGYNYVISKSNNTHTYRRQQLLLKLLFFFSRMGGLGWGGGAFGLEIYSVHLTLIIDLHLFFFKCSNRFSPVLLWKVCRSRERLLNFAFLFI